MGKYRKTKYVGVYVRTIEDRRKRPPSDATETTDAKVERFYIKYVDANGKQVLEKVVISGLPAGQITASKASTLRAEKIKGHVVANVERKAIEKAEKVAKANRWTIDRLWEAWKADPENENKRGTYKADSRYQKHLKESFGNKEPKSITQTDIDRLRLSLAKTHAKETTRSVISLLLRIVRYGAIKGYSPALPFPVVLRGKKLGKDPEIKRAPTDSEIAAYIQTCKEWPDIQAANFQLFMLYTGVRRGSARNLKWSDVCLESGSAVLRDSKTGTVSILLGQDALELLRNHPRTEGAEYVFTGSGPDGIRSDREIDRIPGMIRDAAGIDKSLDPCHMLRRNLATKLDRHGVSTATIMALGGWKSPAMVHHYTATEKETIREAADLLAGTIRTAEGETA